MHAFAALWQKNPCFYNTWGPKDGFPLNFLLWLVWLADWWVIQVNKSFLLMELDAYMQMPPVKPKQQDTEE